MPTAHPCPAPTFRRPCPAVDRLLAGVPLDECLPALLECIADLHPGTVPLLLSPLAVANAAPGFHALVSAHHTGLALPNQLAAEWTGSDTERHARQPGHRFTRTTLPPALQARLQSTPFTWMAGWPVDQRRPGSSLLLIVGGNDPASAPAEPPTLDSAAFIARLVRFAASRENTHRELLELNATLEARVEERTRETRRQAAAMDATFEGMALLEDGRYVYMNPAHETMYGYGRGELLGLPWTTLYDPAELERVQAIALPVVAACGHWTGETTGRRKDGSYFTADVGLTLTPDGRLVCACRDSSERRRQTEALARSQEQLALVIAATQDGFWDWSIPTDRLAFGDRWAEMLGYAPSDLPPTVQTWHTLIHPEDRERVLSETRAMLEDSGRDFQSEYRLRTRDGGWLWVEARGRVVERDRHGHPVRAVGAHTDITRRRVMQDSLRRRTEELIEANAALARAARGRDEFLARVSHELRTPLASVLALTELLLDASATPLPTQAVQHIRTIEESSNHLLLLINDVLDAAKLESGQLQVALQPCEAGSIGEESLALVRPQAARKRLTLEFQSCPPPCQVIADPVRLRQMLVNLLSNAVKFTPEGGEVRLRIESHPERVCFAVSDTGIGIARDRLATLFQPFMQVETGLDRRFGGAGLGLLIVQRFAELHHGSVSVASEPGRGSTFTIDLPRIPLAPPTPLTPEPDRPASVPRSDRQQVLIVDDNAVNRQAIADYLRHVGFEVAAAADGPEGLALASSLRPAVVILDVQMPGMDGLEVTRRLRSLPDPTLARIPILGLTALAMPGDRHRCLAAGMTEYQSKPVPLRKLARLVQDLALAKVHTPHPDATVS